MAQAQPLMGPNRGDYFKMIWAVFVSVRGCSWLFRSVWAGPFIQVKSGFISGWPTSLALFMVVFVLV